MARISINQRGTQGHFFSFAPWGVFYKVKWQWNFPEIVFSHDGTQYLNIPDQVDTSGKLSRALAEALPCGPRLIKFALPSVLSGDGFPEVWSLPACSQSFPDLLHCKTKESQPAYNQHDCSLVYSFPCSLDHPNFSSVLKHFDLCHHFWKWLISLLVPSLNYLSCKCCFAPSSSNSQTNIYFINTCTCCLPVTSTADFVPFFLPALV